MIVIQLSKNILKFCAALFLLQNSGLAIAHHGWSEYDQTQQLTLNGKIVQSGYEHPHGFVKLSIDGKTWTAVLAPPFRMENRGLSNSAIAVGATIRLEGYPHRSKSDEMRAERIIVNGKSIELR
jgi:hypothetical protein